MTSGQAMFGKLLVAIDADAESRASLPLTRQDLAELAGTTLSTASRTLSG